MFDESNERYAAAHRLSQLIVEQHRRESERRREQRKTDIYVILFFAFVAIAFALIAENATSLLSILKF